MHDLRTKELGGFRLWQRMSELRAGDLSSEDASAILHEEFPEELDWTEDRRTTQPPPRSRSARTRPGAGEDAAPDQVRQHHGQGPAQTSSRPSQGADPKASIAQGIRVPRPLDSFTPWFTPG